MTWDAAFDVNDVSFLQAVSWFSERVPITEDAFLRNVEQARRQAFWISGVTSAEIIRDVHESLKEALDKGTPFEEWQKAIGPKLERAWLGTTIAEGKAARTETILRNWAQNAYGRARWDQMAEPAVRRVRPFLMFDATRPTPDPSPICTACDGTVRPANDPWWKNHRPPLHHRCQSGLRSLTAEKAKRLGITAKPPSVGPQEGFGTGEEWKGPDRTKFAPKVKPPKPPKPVPPPPPPQQVIKAKARELSDALTRGDGATARGIFREQIQQTFPGAIPRGGRDSVLQVDDERLSALKANGVRDWDGSIDVQSKVMADGARAAGRYRYGSKVEPWDLAAGLRVIVHEEIHGHSPLTRGSYDGIGLILEEVGTELGARHVMSQLLGYDATLNPYFRAYQAYIVRVVDTVASATGDAKAAAVQRVLAAQSKLWARQQMLQTPDEYAETWADGLDVTPRQRQTILRELRAYAASDPDPND